MWVGLQFHKNHQKELLEKLEAYFQKAPPDTFTISLFPPGPEKAACGDFVIFTSSSEKDVPAPRIQIHDGWQLAQIQEVALQIYAELKAGIAQSLLEVEGTRGLSPLPEVPSQAALTLYTIGHSNLEAEQFLALLKQHQITLLVDVRSSPYSRYVPHFSKSQLERFLPMNGVEYRFAGQYLGGRPTVPEAYNNHAVPPEDTDREDFLKLVNYEAVMRLEEYQRGIKRLLQLIEETPGNVVIMCSESDPRDCHRHHLIARSLIDERVKLTGIPSVAIQHILKDGTLETLEPHDFGPTQMKFFL